MKKLSISKTAGSRIFTYIIYYHVKRREEENKHSRDTKSNFLLSKNDNDQKTGIYWGIFGYDYYLINKFAATDLLYKDHRYCTSGYSK